MNNFDSVYTKLEERRDRALSGKFNCIPLPFARFSTVLPGIEKGRYIVLSGQQKSGKSKLCDFLFIYNPLFFVMDHPELKVKVLYFTLEMSPESKYIEFLCHLLFKLDNIVVSPIELRSVDQSNPVDEHILELLKSEKYQKYIKAYEDMVTYIDDIRNPTGIHKYCRDYAEQHGHFNRVPGMKKNPVTDEYEEGMVIDKVNPYTPDNPEEYRVIIIDNASNISSENGLNKKDTIAKMSQYCITLRNQLNYIVVLIQHQALQKESLEYVKADMIKPTADGLGDSKVTSRDSSMMIGIYSPFKYGIKYYEGYDITKFRDNIRFMEVVEDRDYGANGQICPLFFNGAVSDWKELPRADDAEKLTQVYNYIARVKQAKTAHILFHYALKSKKKKVSLYRQLITKLLAQRKCNELNSDFSEEWFW